MRPTAPTGRRARAIAAIAFAATLLTGSLAGNVAAQGPNQSDVVLVFDFSASILNDKTNRARFADALDRIAERITEISADLIKGETTVSLVQFATKAADYPTCVNLKLRDNPKAVAQFAGCVRSVGNAYRQGPTPARTKAIGVDTNYVAAMQQAAVHLPPTAERPALILFTDGKHDVRGVPASQVPPTRDQLFGSRPSFALLPVGMGLDPKLSGELQRGLEQLRVVKSMPPCADGLTFAWPQVVFGTAGDAGTAVGVALQQVTCTFTVAETPAPTPTPTPPPVQSIRLTPGDGKVDVTWSAPATTVVPIVAYHIRCGTGDGKWIESAETTERQATVSGLTNGTAYQCQVSAAGASSIGAWTSAAKVATPIGRPSPPPKPSVNALDGAVTVGVPPVTSGVDEIRYECSADNGATWPLTGSASGEQPTAQIAGLANGTEYRCRAYAANAVGMSDPSPVSDSVRPCGSTLECNPLMVPVFGGLGVLLGIGILLAALALLRGRTSGYVIAVADVVHTANIGHGRKLGIGFTRDPTSKRVTGIVADQAKSADVRIRRRRGGGFEVSDRTGKHLVSDGEPVVVADSIGVRHSLVLRAFETNAASQVASRR